MWESIHYTCCPRYDLRPSTMKGPIPYSPESRTISPRSYGAAVILFSSF